MRVLHFVERDADAGHVVLATSDGHERFELSVDDPLREALGTAAPASASKAPMARLGAEPRITPREIQMRVRSGETPQAIADTYSAGLDWVVRFAGPVIAERERMAGEARRAKARRSTTEGQTVIFGEAVDERFAAHGIEPGQVRWDSHRREDGQWIISAYWVGGQSERSADWTFNLSGRTVAPADDTAADLLSDRPIRPIATPEQPGAPSLSLAPPLVPGLVAFPAMPDAHTGPLPRAEEVFDQAQFDEATRDGFAEPHLPMHVPDAPPPSTSRIPKVTNLGVAGREDETEDEKAARATIPSWDDILLGVRRKQD
jgi:Protein of unknown function (DUF3071)